MEQSVRLTESSTALKFAPQYVARELGFFEKNGIHIREDVHAGPAGSWLVQNLHQNKADVALGGVWLPLVFNQVNKAQLRPFAVGCRINPAVILGRAGDVKPWRWEDLYGKRVLLSLAATSQWMFLRGVMKEQGLDLGRIHFVRDLHAETTLELWRAGYGDFYLVEAVTAQVLLDEGAQIASTMAEAAGPVPWSVYYASADFIEKHPEAISGFRDAIIEAVAWLYEHSSDEAANVLQPFFRAVSQDHIIRGLDLLKAIRTWPRNAEYEGDAFERYREFMIDYGLLDGHKFHTA